MALRPRSAAASPLLPPYWHLDALQLLFPLQQLLLQFCHPHHILILHVQQLLCELQNREGMFKAVFKPEHLA